MEEIEIKRVIAEISQLIIDKFNDFTQKLKSVETNDVLKRYLKKVSSACASVKEKYIVNFNQISIDDFLRTGDPFYSLSNIKWLYKESEPGFYMLFPSENFKRELESISQELDELLQRGDSYYRQVRDGFNNIVKT